MRGIQGRWITDGKHHCVMIKKCLNDLCDMTTYDSSRMDGIQLVDLRLTLAKVRGENTALFVMKTFVDVPGEAKGKIAFKLIEECMKQAKETSKEARKKVTKIYRKNKRNFLLKQYSRSSHELDSKSVSLIDIDEAKFHKTKALYDKVGMQIDDARAIIDVIDKGEQKMMIRLQKLNCVDFSNAEKKLRDAEKLHRQQQW